MEKELEKKIIRKGIFIFLIVGTIFGSIAVVTAYTISAKEVGYSPKDSSWKVNNVADAIESLKTLKGGSTNYSTEEQVVGTWIDGKPVYQKTIIKESSFVKNEWNFLGQISNVAEVVSTDGIIVDSLAKEKIGGYRDSNLYSYMILDEDGVRVFVGSFSDRNILKIVATIQYTKTTDSATNS